MSDERFDAELTLEDVLPAAEADRLCASLTIVLASSVALLDDARRHYAGTHGLADADATDLVLELEPVGYLLAPAATPVARAAAAALIRQILLARARFRMASAVHRATTEADYEELQRQNAALKTSEARYKALSEELEARVAAQVKVIDERQRQLYQAERLASIGQLAAGVAHEINNPIGFVRSNLGTAQKYLARFGSLRQAVEALPGGPAAWAAADLDFVLEDFADLLADSVGGVDRVARIVADLKGFSNVDRPQEEVIDLNVLLASACNLVEPKLAAGGRLRRDLGQLKPLLCLPGHLAQVFLAVLDNARLAIAGRADGRIDVQSSWADGCAKIRIADNGEGIAAERMPKVFDPFYTTRPVGQGSGLGLTVARDIVLAHGGAIELESNLGEGTVATITIPE